MTYQNPAKLFLTNHNVVSLSDVIKYTIFLRESAGINASPPIDLQKIYGHFGIPHPELVSLPGQEGATVFNSDKPQILIHQGDKFTRRRFTEAHELIEFLIHELPGGFRADWLKETIFGTNKERICQAGAANLLMPRESFLSETRRLGVSFESGKQLAELYQVSLISALFRIADLFPGQVVVVLWRMKNTKAELKRKIPDHQIRMFPDRPPGLAVPKLRVEWAYGEYKNCFIPKNKSIPDDSSVYSAWKLEGFTEGEELLPFRRGLKGYLENLPISIGEIRHVLTFIRSAPF